MSSSSASPPPSASIDRPLALPSGAVLPNRLAKSAMSERLAVRGTPGDALVRLYERWARGGAGLLVTGNVMVDRRHTAEPNNVVVEDDRDLAALTAWAKAATSAGGHAWMQINHPGRQTPRTLDREPVAPSAVPLRLGPTFAHPRALTTSEVEDVVLRFARTAKVAKDAGFTGVQVHGAHGYLVSQFLSPLTNQRTDRYGGSPENRRRFLLDVVAAIRAEVGADYPVGVKLNSADFQKGGFDEEESLAVVQALEGVSGGGAGDAGRGGVDLLEISGGTYEKPAMTGLTGPGREARPGEVRESTKRREAYFLAFADRVRRVSRVPLMVTGGFRTRAAMDDALGAGEIDVVGLARPLAVDPDLPRHLLDRASDAPADVALARTGVKSVDSFVEMAWYGWQLGAMGRGEEPRPGLCGPRAATAYLFTQISG